MNAAILKVLVAWLSRQSLDKRGLFAIRAWKAASLASNKPEEAWQLRRILHHAIAPTWPLLASHELARTYGFFELIRMTGAIDGDVVECGVGHGESLVIMACALALFGIDKKVYGFDSFEGFPDASVHDLSRRVSSVGRPVGWTDTSPEMVNRVFIEDCEKNPNTLFASGPPRPVLVKGFFSDTLEAGLPEKIALLHVDCDLYDSTRDVLRACWARMQPGSTVVFDEYDDVKWPGAKLAVDEFCSKQGKQLVYSSQLQRHTVLV